MVFFKGEEFDLTELHQMLLQITLDIQDALEKESIPFYVLGGTLIGCARNQKFVPWDDDVDIGFEKKYEEQVKNALLKHLSDRYYIECPNTPTNHKQFFRIIKPGTCLIRNPLNRFYKGVDVEMFPLTDVPDPGFKQKVFRILMLFFLAINRAENHFPLFAIKIANRFKKIFFMMFDKLVEKSTCTCMAAMNECFFGEIIPKAYFGTPTKLPFEGTSLYFPENYKDYLTAKYGPNYMELPPESKRVPEYLVLDVNNGWEMYAEDAKRINREN